MEDQIEFDFSSIDHITSSLATFSFQIIEKKEGLNSHDYEAPNICADMTNYYNFEDNQQTDVSSTILKLDNMYDKIMTSMKDQDKKTEIKNKNVYLGDPKLQPVPKKRSLSLNRMKENSNMKVKKEGKRELEEETEEDGRSFSADRYEYPKMDENWLYLPVYEGKPSPNAVLGSDWGKGWGGDGRKNDNYYYHGQNQFQSNNFGGNYERNWGGYYPPYNYYNPGGDVGRFTAAYAQNKLL